MKPPHCERIWQPGHCCNKQWTSINQGTTTMTRKEEEKKKKKESMNTNVGSAGQLPTLSL
jgi:hypothetical protein